MSFSARAKEETGWIGRWWPASALFSWAVAAWVARQYGWEAGCSLAFALAALHRRPWRRWLVALGLPLALWVQGVSLPPWLWLLAAFFLFALYPWRLWRDAPLFLTPPRAFDALPALLTLAPGVKVLDAGCGNGAALRAWRRAYPHAVLHGVEASLLLAAWARWRCPWARVRQGNLWQDDWRDFDLIYLFQRPESMQAALAKALSEPMPGGWLVSLDFPLPGKAPRWLLRVGRHSLHVYARDDLN